MIDLSFFGFGSVEEAKVQEKLRSSAPELLEILLNPKMREELDKQGYKINKDGVSDFIKTIL